MHRHTPRIPHTMKMHSITFPINEKRTLLIAISYRLRRVSYKARSLRSFGAPHLPFADDEEFYYIYSFLCCHIRDKRAWNIPLCDTEVTSTPHFSSKKREIPTSQNTVTACFLSFFFFFHALQKVFTDLRPFVWYIAQNLRAFC